MIKLKIAKYILHQNQQHRKQHNHQQIQQAIYSEINQITTTITTKSKSPPLKIQSASIQLIDVASPRNQQPSKQASPKDIQQFTKSKPKSPSVNIASPVQQFMKLSAKMKQSFNKQQCSSARNNTNIPNSANQRKSSVTHILNILKSPNKNSSQQIQHVSSTPRDQESKRSFNNKKVHQLELQVMSDLQSLLQKDLLNSQKFNDQQKLSQEEAEYQRTQLVQVCKVTPIQQRRQQSTKE